MRGPEHGAAVEHQAGKVPEGEPEQERQVLVGPLLFVDVDGVISLFGFAPDMGRCPDRCTGSTASPIASPSA